MVKNEIIGKTTGGVRLINRLLSTRLFDKGSVKMLYYKRISGVYDEEFQVALEESGGDLEYASLPE